MWPSKAIFPRLVIRFSVVTIEIVVDLELAYNKKDVTNLENKVFTNRIINS